MAQRQTKKETNTKKGEKRDFKNQPFSITGKIEKWDTFGSDNNHAWFVVTDDLTSTKYTFKAFFINDNGIEDKLCDCEKVTVGFNITYNRNGNNIQLQLVAHTLESAD